MKTKQISFLVMVLMAIVFTPKTSFSHCQVPCGIYEDSLRIALMKEHVVTIKKSMAKINELSLSEKQEQHQIIRWVINKEEHASKIQDLVMDYFLTQRLKPVDPANHHYNEYILKLGALHKIGVLAMKCKQGIQLTTAADLLKAIQVFEGLYFHEHRH